MKRSAVLLGFALLLIPSIVAQTNQAFETKKQQAFTLFELGRQKEALPLLEDLSNQKPDDYVILERYAMCVLMNSAIVTDDQTRKEMRAQAKKLFKRSQELGNTSQLVHVADDIPDDGGFEKFSESQAVDSAMKAGEAAFAEGDYDKAIENYQRAVVLDPKNYEAPLFIGDMYFRKGMADDAGKWFAHAIEIDPNRETAYRYWGDTLKQGKRYDEAKQKFIQAIIAEPYNRTSWIGLANWANDTGHNLVRANIQPPTKVDDTEKGANITLDANMFGTDKEDNGGAAWLMYPMTHVKWKSEGEFLKRFPNEKQYRHSLAEEEEALSGVVTVVKELQADKKKAKKMKLDPQLQKLVELSDQGLLESYILIHRADDGIIQDYAAYREAHRDKLQAYVESLIVAN